MGRPLFYEFVPKACQTLGQTGLNGDDEAGLADTRFVVGRGKWVLGGPSSSTVLVSFPPFPPFPR